MRFQKGLNGRLCVQSYYSTVVVCETGLRKTMSSKYKLINCKAVRNEITKEQNWRESWKTPAKTSTLSWDKVSTQGETVQLEDPINP
jgi:hypothetical protein